jgi:hypothetical protein
LQLSSPIEEATIDSLAATTDNDAVADQGRAVFRGVETNQATLTCSVYDVDIPLGSSDPCDLAPICQVVNVMESESASSVDHVTEISLPIQAPTNDAIDTADASNNMPICTVHLKFVYTPSNKDRREELYDLLNQASQHKAAAVDKLRQSAVAASRQQLTNGSSNVVSKPSSNQAAVRAGFLNKPKNKQPVSRVMQLYRTYLGPESLLRTLLPMAQNYLIFGGFVVAMHFRGHLLALPAPV